MPSWQFRKPMPKNKKIAPSPSASGIPYKTFPTVPQPGGSGESSSSRGRQRSRVYTPRACQNCQIKKTKCSGQPPPCNRCAAENIECVFDRSTDQRRREASEKNAEENRRVRQCLDQLLELLGGTDEQKLGRVREMVREGVDWTGILEFLEQMHLGRREGKQPESSVGQSGTQTEESSTYVPIAFDEWIAEVFGSPEEFEDNLAFE